MQNAYDEATGLLLSAIHFSASKHRDQRRKDQTNSPYINHPIQVSQTLWQIGSVRDPITLISAVLHDTLEDTETQPNELADLFGEEVLAVVLEVTDDKSLPKMVRKQLQIEHSPHISKSAKLVKLADKICNLSDLLSSPPADWSLERRQDYLMWTEKVVNGLRGTNAALEEKYDTLFKNGKQILEIT
jgi:guanosine-3',5'-bis(diphosphate) 3'-pyrophosphohydrolase